ncbi:CatB-related O-acetyltransferase [Vibrio cortegadensis]|uniref:CatB-related O-acetyltransferase n=1 Tax=Vibrio cortegadensis TaxID=1328770 RepID=UPI00352DD9C1
MKTFIKWLIMRIMKISLHFNKVHFMKGSRFCRASKFEGYNSIGEDNNLTDVSIGRGSYTGHNVRLSSVKIGRFSSIASGVKNTTGNHPTSKYISTHPAFFSQGKAAGFTFSEKQLFNELNRLNNEYLVEIGNDVWIGEDVLILDGIKIGNGSIIGARSLVTKDIPPYSICVGTPAKVIKFRFKEKEIRNIESKKWWKWDFNKLKENSTKFSDIENFTGIK